MNRTPVFAILALLLAAPAGAAVLSSAPAGFLVKDQAMIGAAPDRVFTALTAHIGEWWDPAHTFSRDARNLSLDPRPGGCFCETLPNGGGVRHLEVVFVAPGETLRLTGALGPLQGSGLAGSMTWALQAAGDSTRVDLDYSVGGYYEGGLTEMAPLVDSVLLAQLLRLKRFVETGNPAAR
jgi:uncharacterized protein YndB with AHSA1/START domain